MAASIPYWLPYLTGGVVKTVLPLPRSADVNDMLSVLVQPSTAPRPGKPPPEFEALANLSRLSEVPTETVAIAAPQLVRV